MRTAARTQLDRAADYPEPPGYGGDFYIPFLAEGYLHLEANEKAASYIERIRNLRGFMYYGSSVDRVLGVVAARSGDWAMAEQAFEDGFLGRQMPDLSHLYDLTLLNQVLAEKKRKAIQ